MNEILIQADHVALTYGRQPVLSDVSMSIARSEFWFFLGPNGHGKTTMLRAMLGLMKPSSGNLTLGVDRARIGFVPQRCDLNPSLPTTVREFVSLGLVGVPGSRSDRAERLAWALDQVGLAPMTTKSYWALSGGQRQRALLARALARRPELLVLDEPTNGLDLSSESALLDALARLNRDARMTILLVTHDLPLASRYASHVALFRDGRVIAGERAVVLTSARLAETYGVSLALAETELRS